MTMESGSGRRRRAAVLAIGLGAAALAGSPALADTPAVASVAATDPGAAEPGYPSYTLYRTMTYQGMATFNDFVYATMFGGGIAAGGALAAASLVTEPITFYLHETVWQTVSPHHGPADFGLTAAKTATYTMTNMTRVFASAWLLTGSTAFAAGFVAFNAVGDAIVYSVNDIAWTCIAARHEAAAAPTIQSATPAMCLAATQPNAIAGPSVMPPPG